MSDITAVIAMKGYAGKILWIDLSSQTYRTEPLEEKVAKNFIGGKGFGAWLLTNFLKEGTEPLSPENVLAFFVGPLTGTKAPTSNRYGVFFKSPLTGIWGESYAGGHLGPHIKRAGYDGIVITGVSDRPVFLTIIDDVVEFHDANSLWGNNTRDTEDRVREISGESRMKVMTIGPAGENLVKFACICNDYFRQAGRAGGGAVMGSKKLKAIGILGTGKVELADGESFDKSVKEVLSKIPKDGPLTTEGTPVMVNAQNALGTFPTHYWQKGVFENYHKINSESMRKLIVDRNKACWNCPVACGKLSSVKDGEYRGTVVEGPEYETIFAFGGLCEIDDIRAIAKMNEVCDLLGMDTITSGNVVGFTMRAYELGKLESEFPIEFGDHSVTLKLLNMIAFREGIGDVLAEGVRGAAAKLGLEEIAVHVKGLEPAGYDPRGYNGMALSYGIGVRGADHLRSSAYGLEMRGISDRFMVTGKGKFVKEQEDHLAIIDSMIVCNFVRGAYDWNDFVSLHRAATGIDITVEELKRAAERIINTARWFSVREGIKRKDDMLPSVFHEVPFAEGGSRVHVVVRSDYEKMLEEYYQARGWDRDGIPLSR